jgi:CDP-diacylglycerol--serine O-phosphatidyltransferase
MKKGNVVKILVYLVIFFSFLYLYPIEMGAFLVSAYLIYGIGRAIYTVFIAKYAKN